MNAGTLEIQLAADVARLRSDMGNALGIVQRTARGFDDAAAQIENAGDFPRRHRHAGEPVGHEDILHAGNRQAEELPADHHRDEFEKVAVRGLG